MRAIAVVALLVVAAVLVTECKPIPKSSANSKEKLRERTRAKLAKTKALSAKGHKVVAKKQHKMQTQLASLMLDLEKHDKKMETYKHSKTATQHTLDAEYIHKMEAKMQDMTKTVESLRSQIAKLEQTAAKPKPLHTLAEDAEKTKDAPKEKKEDPAIKTKDAKKAPVKKAEEKKATEEKKADRNLEESEDKELSTANLEESNNEYSGNFEESESESGSDDSDNYAQRPKAKVAGKDYDDDMTEVNKDEESEASQAEKEAELEESESDKSEEEEVKVEEKKTSHKKVRDMDAKPKQKKTPDNADEDGEGNVADEKEPGILDSLGISPYLPAMPTIFGGEEEVAGQLDDAASLEESPYGSEAEDANSWF